MTLVTRGVSRLARQSGKAVRNARANAAFFTTAANQAPAMLASAKASSSRMTPAAKPGE